MQNHRVTEVSVVDEETGCAGVGKELLAKRGLDVCGGSVPCLVVPEFVTEHGSGLASRHRGMKSDQLRLVFVLAERATQWALAAELDVR